MKKLIKVHGVNLVVDTDLEGCALCDFCESSSSKHVVSATEHDASVYDDGSVCADDYICKKCVDKFKIAFDAVAADPSILRQESEKGYVAAFSAYVKPKAKKKTSKR